jgi:phosphoribosylpyrophosphate synthetase
MVARLIQTVGIDHVIAIDLHAAQIERLLPESQVHVVGDVRNRPCLIVDDMISTGGTLADSLRTLVNAGARAPIIIAATHGLLLLGSKTKLAMLGRSD